MTVKQREEKRTELMREKYITLNDKYEYAAKCTNGSMWENPTRLKLLSLGRRQQYRYGESIAHRLARHCIAYSKLALENHPHNEERLSEIQEAINAVMEIEKAYYDDTIVDLVNTNGYGLLWEEWKFITGMGGEI